MYTVIILILAFLGIRFIYVGAKKQKRSQIYLGGAIILLTFLFFQFMSFWGDKLWYDSLEFTQRFWIEIGVKAGLIVAGAIVAGLLILALTTPIDKRNIFFRYLALGIGILYGGIWGYSNWEVILKFFNSVNAGITEPILQRDAAFYMFKLPLFKELVAFFIVTFIISLGGLLLSLYSQDNMGGKLSYEEINYLGVKIGRAVVIAGSLFFIALALQKYLARFDLLFSEWGAVSGPGWTDEHIRFPVYLISSILTFLVGLSFFLPASRRKFIRLLKRYPIQPYNLVPSAFGILFGIILGIWLLLLAIVPAAFQSLIVEPNEISMETPYIENNIQFTRHGFDLDEIEERQYPANKEFTRATVDSNQTVFSNIRLWDWNALLEVYNQFQEIRLYYDFSDIDIDRYTFNNRYQQVMIAAREMELDNLPPQSQTFVNRRFKYTHGYGITMTKVNEFTQNGLPVMPIKNIPPETQYPELKVEQPEIYYGEATRTHVIANSKTEEFDYPSGEENIYTSYDGSGGVQLSSSWRKFLFGWKFDGTKFFFSSYPDKTSRLMFNREISSRTKKVAPFLEYDDDPYPVLVDGKLYWILDAYTTSNNFPYSQPYNSREVIDYSQGDVERQLVNNVAPHFNGANYMRNSVKVVVDAFNGNIDYYIYDEDDPIIQVWDNVFPGMFKEESEMPEALRSHVRYPVDKMLVQGQVYAKYHMSDPRVFYNQEDLWLRATEKYQGTIKPVDPYFIMWQRPGSNEAEFTLIQPFTPKNRQVLIGWVAGLSDGENYGRFMTYKFPKDRRILGPQQVETKIDQDAELSSQLSLWDQRGSTVIRGNVLAIPVGETVMYVEPIYLQSETAAYPELRLVCIMHEDNLSYASSFDEALEGIFRGEPVKKITKAAKEEIDEREEREETEEEKQEEVDRGITTNQQLIQDADEYLNSYLRNMGDQNFDQASRSLQQLKETLNKLKQQSQQDTMQ
ncbi:MAG: UPF0182 family protein [Bacteroidales bacterium]